MCFYSNVCVQDHVFACYTCVAQLMKHAVTLFLGICGIIESNEKEEKTRRDFTYYVHDDNVLILEFARITCLKCQKANY